jgi:UDP-N-acetylmuramoylalanine--D-glutamate ligase
MAFPTNTFAGARFAILGLGRNGLPAARALRAMGAETVLWDDGAEARAAAEADGFSVVDLATGDFAFDALVLSPGIPHILPAPHPIAARAIALGIPVLSDAELLYQAVRRAGSQARFAGITGTNGKSTTTALLAHILTEAGMPVAAGGNLGTAALSLPLLPDDGIYVLEMSSYMLERIATLRFNTAAMLNLSPDHLDRHGNMSGYAHVKRKIFARQTGDDVAVVGIDDALSMTMADGLAKDCPAHIMRRTPPLRAPWPARSALTSPQSHAASRISPACRIARVESAFMTASFSSMIARQRMPIRRRAPLAVTSASCGLRAAFKRRAASPCWRNSSRASCMPS